MLVGKIFVIGTYTGMIFPANLHVDMDFDNVEVVMSVPLRCSRHTLHT